MAANGKPFKTKPSTPICVAEGVTSTLLSKNKNQIESQMQIQTSLEV